MGKAKHRRRVTIDLDPSHRPVAAELQPMEFDSYQELWDYLYQDVEEEYEGPALDVWVRSWEVVGFQPKDIAYALFVAAQRTRVAFEDKLAYAGGVLRNCGNRKPEVFAHEVEY